MMMIIITIVKILDKNWSLRVF